MFCYFFFKDHDIRGGMAEEIDNEYYKRQISFRSSLAHDEVSRNENRGLWVRNSMLGPLHMSPVDRAGPVFEISPHL